MFFLESLVLANARSRGGGIKNMCSSYDGCWAYPSNNQRLNRTSPADRLAGNDYPIRLRNKRLSHPTESNFVLKVILCAVKWILHTVLFTLFLGTTVLVVPISYCVRKIVLHCSLRHHRGGKLTKMSASEAVWLASCANTERATPVSNIFFIFEGKVTMEEVHNFVQEKLFLEGKVHGNNLRFLKFRHFPVRVMNGFGWKEFDNLNISSHVFENLEKSLMIPVDLKGMTQTPDTGYLEKLWRVLLFPEFKESGDTGVLIQIHECIADIFPSTRVVLEALDYKTIYLKGQCFLLGRLATYFCACYTGPFVILKRLLMRGQKKLWFTSSEETADPFHVSWSRAVDLKSVKRIKDITRTKGKSFVLCTIYISTYILFFMSYTVFH